MSRLPSGGLIDRSVTLPFRFDGRRLHGHPGDTLASALLASGVRVAGHSVNLGRPRGIFTSGPEEPNALVRVGADPMLAATTVELHAGLEAWSLRGKGRLDPGAVDDRRHDKGYLHCEVLVVGGGPAGLAAALAAGESGLRVILVDDQPRLGGDLLGSRVLLDGAPALGWVAAAESRLAALPEVRVLTRTTATGFYDHGYVVAVERRPRGERLWHFRAGRVVLATGAHERSLPFPGNDLPGVMLAAAARTYANRYGVRPGARAVVYACADSGYEAARDLAAAGVEIAAVVDPRPEGLSGALAGRVTGTVAGDDGTLAAVLIGDRRVEADLLAVAGGWNPAVHLFSQSQGRLRFDETLRAFVPGEPAQAMSPAGACRGLYGTAQAIEDGYRAGAEAHGPVAGLRVPVSDEPALRPPAAYWGELDPDPTAFVDLQRDVTVADVARATGAGMRSVEHVKRFTTASTGADQGKASGALVVGVLSELLGAAPGQVGVTTFRPPYTPVSFATLAGRDRGPLSDPARTTAMHGAHVARGAVFEDVGQWKRPWYFPLGGETMREAVRRECEAARTAVAAMDASTLGKIDIRGADAGAFLDRIYTNMYSTLAVGACRYGLMCTADGMVFDDGTTTRLGEHHYLMTTTTGNAAAVLDWLEEWHQTAWPSLDVRFTSVTDHWATVAVAGPLAGTVIAAVAPEAVGLAFMRYTDAAVLGVPGRVFRISFSGELAYEVNVPWHHGRALWEAVLDLGAVPYGTETMHVLRAEKGFPIVGQDTDGTVTPQDLGMSWIVSGRKPDFVGKRSHARPDTSRTDRKRLVGLLTEDPSAFVEEGAQLVADGVMLGHVTSSYPSVPLGRAISLALARNVSPGDRLTAISGDTATPVRVVSPIFYDPDNLRRDGNPTPQNPPPQAIPPAEIPPASSQGVVSSEVTPGSSGGVVSSEVTPGSSGGVVSSEVTPASPQGRVSSEVTPTTPQGTVSSEVAPSLRGGVVSSGVTSGSPGGAVSSEVTPTRPEGTVSSGGGGFPVLRMWAESPAAGFGERFAGVGGGRVRVREVPFVPMWEVRGEDPGRGMRLGPQWWLVVGEGEPGLGWVDVSGQRTVIELSGPGALDVLITGCPIDLHPGVFTGHAQTVLGKAPVILQRYGDSYRIFVRSSYANYLGEWLIDALEG
ncbi:2Fe-2S iron-sulfur cluster-binding protein [Nonomuraea sp. C10]|uniref:2Fe-2S iron-sulfur cluster-binding protein n=1 Tax=Nonomuraea sp. C10 TaxID=2600577 RepID=UPI0021C4A0EA|nr:2Fe-2S iron-sulfur cluster-binding protein [Nonomuraea sp. C10]